MAFRVLLLCASALLVQVQSQCYSGANLAGYGLGGGLALDGLAGYGLGAGCGCGGVASTGGGLAVNSASLCAPVGLSVQSDNVYEGGLSVGGNLPFLGTVGLEGILPTAGAGAVSYGCGNGNIGIAAEEGPIVTGIAAPGAYGPGIGAIVGNGIGLANGLGYGLNGAAGLGAAGLAGINAYNAGLGGIGYGLGLGNGCGCNGLY